MKIKNVGLWSLAAGGLILASGCVVQPDGRVAFEPVVVAAPAPVVVESEPPPPPPGVVVDVGMVPDDYVWDGYEYVGIVGDQYFYLGPGNVWLVCDPIRINHFHVWVGGHPDWRAHFVHNDRFRNDAHGHFHPVGERRGRDVHRDDHHDDHH